MEQGFSGRLHVYHQVSSIRFIQFIIERVCGSRELVQDRITGGCDEKAASTELVHFEEDACLVCPDATGRKINN